jgi:hypothetical protein
MTQTAEATRETTPEVAEAVRKYRKSATAERGIRYRMGRGQAGTTRATEYALDLHATIKARSVATLMDAGYRGWVGMLVEEESLAERLRVASAQGQERPELAGRLADLRRKIRRYA